MHYEEQSIAICYLNSIRYVWNLLIGGDAILVFFSVLNDRLRNHSVLSTQIFSVAIARATVFQIKVASMISIRQLWRLCSIALYRSPVEFSISDCGGRSTKYRLHTSDRVLLCSTSITHELSVTREVSSSVSRMAPSRLVSPRCRLPPGRSSWMDLWSSYPMTNQKSSDLLVSESTDTRWCPSSIPSVNLSGSPAAFMSWLDRWPNISSIAELFWARVFDRCRFHKQDLESRATKWAWSG
mmetsp:Transcript_11942/g.28341  ORF Transcript_11942/g.28341 Transcript_11942/m.28341 type:complete len:240 (-) Transcript_11942:862-1581(-)